METINLRIELDEQITKDLDFIIKHYPVYNYEDALLAMVHFGIGKFKEEIKKSRG